MDYKFHNHWSRYLPLLAALLALPFSVSAASTPSVVLSWNASTSTGVAGYHVSYGLVSRTYTQRVDSGNNTSKLISGLTAGKTYYFAVSAYNAAGAESSLSNEVSFSTGSSGSPPPTVTPAPTPRPTVTPSPTAAPSPTARPTSTPVATPTPQPTASSTPITRNANSPYLNNVSTRVHVGVGNNVAIVGFTITGTGRKTVVVRALGPTLVSYGLGGTLFDPYLEIHNSAGDVIASNDNWPNAQESAFAPGGRYHALQPSKNLEPAIALSLPAGAYTMVVGGKKGVQGVALAEIYDFSQDVESKLTNISTRAQVLTGEDVLIGGVTVAGSSSLKLVLRTIGPSLSKYGVTDALQNPTMALYNSNGALLRTSDAWRSDANQASELISTGYAPADSREPAMIVQLPAGTYTAVVEGKNGTTGVALFDAYTLN